MTPHLDTVALEIDPDIKLISRDSNESIPIGLCQCGCGEATPLAPATNKNRGRVRGVPIQFVHGHNRRRRTQMEDAVPFKIDGTYCKLVPLTRGLHAIVHAADYEMVMRINWRAAQAMNSNYAVHQYLGSDGKMKFLSMHSLLCPTSEGMTADHINHCGIDNRRDNLRPATIVEQGRNCQKKRGTYSKYKGVCINRGRKCLVVQIRYDGKDHCVGRFPLDREIEAAKAYDREAIKHFGEFAVLNFPRSDYGL